MHLNAEVCLYLYLNVLTHIQISLCLNTGVLTYAKICSFDGKVTEIAVINKARAESEGRFNGNSCFVDVARMCGDSQNYWHPS